MRGDDRQKLESSSRSVCVRSRGGRRRRRRHRRRLLSVADSGGGGEAGERMEHFYVNTQGK